MGVNKTDLKEDDFDKAVKILPKKKIS